MSNNQLISVSLLSIAIFGTFIATNLVSMNAVANTAAVNSAAVSRPNSASTTVALSDPSLKPSSTDPSITPEPTKSKQFMAWPYGYVITSKTVNNIKGFNNMSVSGYTTRPVGSPLLDQGNTETPSYSRLDDWNKSTIDLKDMYTVMSDKPCQIYMTDEDAFRMEKILNNAGMNSDWVRSNSNIYVFYRAVSSTAGYETLLISQNKKWGESVLFHEKMMDANNLAGSPQWGRCYDPGYVSNYSKYETYFRNQCKGSSSTSVTCKTFCSANPTSLACKAK